MFNKSKDLIIFIIVAVIGHVKVMSMDESYGFPILICYVRETIVYKENQNSNFLPLTIEL